MIGKAFGSSAGGLFLFLQKFRKEVLHPLSLLSDQSISGSEERCLDSVPEAKCCQDI